MAATSPRWIAALRLPHTRRLPAATSGSFRGSARARRPAPWGRPGRPEPAGAPPLPLPQESKPRPGRFYGVGPPAPAGWLQPVAFPFLVRGTGRSKLLSIYQVLGEGWSRFARLNVATRGRNSCQNKQLLNHGSFQPSFLSPKPENQNKHKVVLAGRAEGGNSSWGGPASVGSRLQVGRDGWRAGRPRTARRGCSLRAKKGRSRGAQRGDKGDGGRTEAACSLPALPTWV